MELSSFEDMAKVMGISKQRVKQIYDRAMVKASALARKEGITLEEVAEEFRADASVFDVLEGGLLYDLGLSDELTGFWREEHNKGSSNECI